jgi:hypothetical protein
VLVVLKKKIIFIKGCLTKKTPQNSKPLIINPMNSVDVNNIIKKVWTNTSKYEIVSTSDKSIVNISAKPIFIHPKLKVVKDEANCPIIIVSAPGAVGKTTFAKYFAFEKKAFYWDLSKIKLGDNTFIGTLANTFGAHNLSKVIFDIGQGNISFFIDAFDEAEIISGWDGVEKFIREIYGFCKSSPKTNMFCSQDQKQQSLFS